MIPTLRTLTLWVAATAVAAFGAASVGSYRPSGVTDRALALESLKRALASIDDEALDSTTRLTAYRRGLNETDALLRQALRSNPTDTASIERLAMVRWESGVLAGGPEPNSVSAMMAIAAARAPRVPEIQADLGALVFRMGRPDEAAPFMRRAVELSPQMTSRVVATMLDAGITPATIVTTMPTTVELLVALRDSFARTGDWSGWLASAERLLPEHPRELMVYFTDACLASKEVNRLLQCTERLGTFSDKRAEAERQIAIARAYLDMNAMSLAATSAAAAQALSPSDPRLLELVGQVALLANDSAKAEGAFRDALGALARSGVLAIDRARLYRERGQALEQLGRVDEAFDEYRRASELSPDDPWIRQRFAESAPRQAFEGVR